jgi:hypothetical protein
MLLAPRESPVLRFPPYPSPTKSKGCLGRRQSADLHIWGTNWGSEHRIKVVRLVQDLLELLVLTVEKGSVLKGSSWLWFFSQKGVQSKDVKKGFVTIYTKPPSYARKLSFPCRCQGHEQGSSTTVFASARPCVQIPSIAPPIQSAQWTVKLSCVNIFITLQNIKIRKTKIQEKQLE